MERYSLDRYVGIIATSNGEPFGWRFPDLHAWITRVRYDDNGRPNGYLTAPAPARIIE